MLKATKEKLDIKNKMVSHVENVEKVQNKIKSVLFAKRHNIDYNHEVWKRVFNERMAELLDPKKKKKKHKNTILAIRGDESIGRDVVLSHHRMMQLKQSIKTDCWYMNVYQGRMLTATMKDPERVRYFF